MYRPVIFPPTSMDTLLYIIWLEEKNPWLPSLCPIPTRWYLQVSVWQHKDDTSIYVDCMEQTIREVGQTWGLWTIFGRWQEWKRGQWRNGLIWSLHLGIHSDKYNTIKDIFSKKHVFFWSAFPFGYGPFTSSCPKGEASWTRLLAWSQDRDHQGLFRLCKYFGGLPLLGSVGSGVRTRGEDEVTFLGGSQATTKVLKWTISFLLSDVHCTISGYLQILWH